jgi:crossover junction endodeoxyribonuclease RusA
MVGVREEEMLKVSPRAPSVAFTVWGIPAPKGSKRAFAIRKGGRPTGRVAVVDDSKPTLRDWTRAVNDVIQGLAASGTARLDGPVGLSVEFWMPKPKSAPKRRRTWPDRKPDIDKLLRALLDPMTGVLIEDDARVVALHAWKNYAEDSGDPRPRANVALFPVNVEASSGG